MEFRGFRANVSPLAIDIYIYIHIYIYIYTYTHTHTHAHYIYTYIYIYIYDPGPRSRSPPPPPPQWYGPPLAVPQTSRLHAVCRLSPQLRAICCVWVMSSLVCGLFASIWDLRFLICRLLEASMHFCLYYVLIPRHVYCHHHSCLASVLLMCC